MGRRTPLMRAMRELAEVHASLPEDRALSIDEAIDLRRRRSAGGISCRVRASWAPRAVAVSPLAALARPRRHGVHDPRVVVVGAGLAGVCCAYKLQQHGIRADLYEARDRVGGRCWTARTFDGGQVAEHGGEFVDTRHVQLRRSSRPSACISTTCGPPTRRRATSRACWSWTERSGTGTRCGSTSTW